MTPPRGHRSRSQPRWQLLGEGVVVLRDLLFLLQIPPLSLTLALALVLALVLATGSPPELMFLSLPLPDGEREGSLSPVPFQVRMLWREGMLMEKGMLMEQGMELMAQS